MKIIDISWPIHPDMTAYKDRKTVAIESVKKFENDAVRESLITLGSHSGTHVDFAAHFKKDGRTSNQQDLSQLIGNAKVCDVTNVKDVIQSADLERFEIGENDIVLLKTTNSLLGLHDSFDYGFVCVGELAAKYLISKKIKAIGIDYLGIERGGGNHAVHNLFFENNVVIVEGLRLKDAKTQEYLFLCLPLAFEGLEAAPARAILFDL